MNNKKLKFDWILFLKGIAMGAADVIPGVSGGTIAFITGIYDDFIDSIKAINLKNASLLFQKKIALFWKKINGSFLTTLLLGIIISIQSLARIITFLLDRYPIPLWAFFFGLILASSVYILQKISNWNILHFLMLLLGGSIAFSLTVITPMKTPESLWFIFLCGMISISAMILPGISGSFILLILGKYKYILIATKQLNFLILGVFCIGMLVGIMSFSRILSWCLHRYHTLTIALLSGFMLGSLPKIWPWKTAIGNNLINILTYQEIVGKNPKILIACTCGIIGYLVVHFLHKQTAR